MIAIIDYGSGNLESVKKAFDYLGKESIVTDKAEDIEKADSMVLPGVGSFGFMMQNLKKKGLDTAIRKTLTKGTPFLGICLGLQALFEQSEESPGVRGLGIFKGKCIRFRQGKVPQIGWNRIMAAKIGIFNDDYFYFVNSYCVIPDDKDIIAAKTNYFTDFVSAIQSNNITAVQFHPEKSGIAGLELIKRWLEC